MNRPTKDEYYLNIALAVSKRSTCLRRHYGVVIVNNDVIVSTGYNGSPRGEINCCDLGECKRLHMSHNSIVVTIHYAQVFMQSKMQSF